MISLWTQTLEGKESSTIFLVPLRKVLFGPDGQCRRRSILARESNPLG